MLFEIYFLNISAYFIHHLLYLIISNFTVILSKEIHLKIINSGYDFLILYERIVSYTYLNISFRV